MVKNRGITLVALVVTIIILLILAGVSISISNKSVINTAIEATDKNIEASIKEQVEFAWVSAETAYLNKSDASIDKITFFNIEMKKFLEDSGEYQNISVTNNGENINISLDFNENNYNFTLSKSGEVTSLGKLLKGNVKIGDYINYPVEYVDLYTGISYNSSTGWKVIDNGASEDSPYVKIISTGIPARWKDNSANYSSINDVIFALRNNFESLELLGKSVRDKVNPEIYKVDNLAYKVTTITKEDIDRVGLNSDLIMCSTSQPYEYWVATLSDSNDGIYYMTDLGLEIYNNRNYRTGIRPIIYLKDGLTGKVDENNVWKISK